MKHVSSPRRLLAVVLALACAARRPMAYQLHRAAADRAFLAGRMREAASELDRAAAATTRPLDRDEALFLAASALARAGDRAAAIERFERLAESSPVFERGARAALEAGRLRLAAGETERALADLEALVLRASATGPARRALTLLLDAHDAADPSCGRGLGRLAVLLPALAGTALEDTALWERARRLARAGRSAEAIAAYETLLVTVGYPFNRHWDDGAVAQARLLVAAGDARRAVAVLERMLAVRESSFSNGSYEAPHFGEGALLRARILRDELGDPAAAAEALHFVFTSFPTSRLRDDALWEESELRARLGEVQSACALRLTLAREYPCTRHGRRAAEALAACGVAGPVEPSAEGRRRCD